MNHPLFELVIFDMDGVLANTSQAHSRAFSELWSKIGIDGPPYESIAGMKTIDAVRQVLGNSKVSMNDLDQWVSFKQEKAREYLMEETFIFEDTLPSLLTLTKHQMPMALGTSASRETTILILNRLRLTPFFRVIVTADEVERGKPSPEIYQKVMSLAGTGSNRTLIVEDSASGLFAALASGAYAASVRSGIGIEQERFLGSFATLHHMLQQILSAYGRTDEAIQKF